MLLWVMKLSSSPIIIIITMIIIIIVITIVVAYHSRYHHHHPYHHHGRNRFHILNVRNSCLTIVPLYVRCLQVIWEDFSLLLMKTRMLFISIVVMMMLVRVYMGSSRVTRLPLRVEERLLWRMRVLKYMLLLLMMMIMMVMMMMMIVVVESYLRWWWWGRWCWGRRWWRWWLWVD